MTDEDALEVQCAEVAAGCACQGVRRSARALTQIYDHAFAPIGIKATQFPILVALAMAGPVPLSPVAEALVMDRTTLTRNLKSLQNRNLVKVEHGKDRRVRLLSLTGEGRQVLEQALKLWKVAQSSVQESFGPERLNNVLGELYHLTNTVRA